MVQAVTLTLAEASEILEPAIDLAPVVKVLGWQPSGHRYTGRAGRPAPCYEAAKLMRLHAALVPFLGDIDVRYPRATALPGDR